MSAIIDWDRRGNCWVIKERSLDKIDPAMALCLALGAAAAGSRPMVPDVRAMIA